MPFIPVWEVAVVETVAVEIELVEIEEKVVFGAVDVASTITM